MGYLAALGFGVRSYDAIVGGLSKIVTDLRKHADYQHTQHIEKLAEAVRLSSEAEDHEIAATKALATASHIQSLINPDV